MTMGYGTSHQRNTHFLSVVLRVTCISLWILSSIVDAKYVWKTGLWIACQHDSCGAGGFQFRSVFCAEEGEYNFNSQDDNKCSHMHKPSDRKECFKACGHHESKVRWAATVWSECRLKPEVHVCSIKHGYHTRNVTCVWRQTGAVEDDSVCAEFEPKPDLSEKCDLKCPQDCVVTEFSSWAESNCDTCLIVNKTRTREMVVPPDPSRGGKPCPPFTEMIPCENCKGVFTYQAGPWEACTTLQDLPPHSLTVQPALGYQKRDIQCINNIGEVVSYVKCVDHYRGSLGEIVSTQTCVVPQDCQVTGWSQWSPHNTSCLLANGTQKQGYMVRSRSVTQLPLGSGKPCPALVHYFPLQAERERSCFKSRWVTTGWSECLVPDGGYSCTMGLKTRRAICMQEYDEGKDRPVADEHCVEKRPPTAQVCQAECSLDCAMSHWTPWSDCKVTDCELYARRRRNNQGTGQRHRTRAVLTPAQGSGLPCPHQDETQTCDPQPCYTWNLTLGPCTLLNPAHSPTCGLGIAYRTLACVNKGKFTVDNSLCEDLSEIPANKEDCSIPCPSDCILSPWSPWSPCRGLCQEGRTTPAIQKRERSILAQAGVGGAPCPPNRQLTEVQICPTTIECAIYVWRAEPWAPCQPNDTATQCGPGVQSREVSCYSLLGQPVIDQRCTLKVQPAVSQECVVPCPVNCEVTEFSDWSACSSTCWTAQQTVPIQTRVRYVLREAQHGGQSCPPPNKLTEVRRCNNFTQCETYYWQEETWGRCVLPPDRIPHCGRGLQSRDVSCYQDNGTQHDPDVCIRGLGMLPDVTRECMVSCNLACQFTEWGPWSTCINGCDGKRFKTRKIIEDEGTPVSPVCRDNRLYPLDAFEKCLCDTHKPVAVGNWSECILETDNYLRSGSPFNGFSLDESPALETTAVCGQGLLYRAIMCQNDRRETQSASKCSLKSHEEKRCLIQCPVDCVMSEWTAWSDCSTSCGMGRETRYRRVQQTHTDGGRPCPQLDIMGKETQTRVCDVQCVQYGWRPYKWDPCMPHMNGAVCGNGNQTRTVRCERSTTEGITGDELIDDSLCQGQVKPQGQRMCYSPCTGECVVSEWSDWSVCRQPCVDPNQVQRRTRTVLRNPSDNPAYTCPRLLEERFCVRGDNCNKYTWANSEWTSCLVNNGTDSCGTGHKERQPLCHNQNGQPVNNQLCVQALGEWTEPAVLSCEVACDVDCFMTEWTAWSMCIVSCDLGMQTRTREVLKQPHGNGRPCPDTTLQEKPCFPLGCYSWLISDWSTCIHHAGMCGDGVQTRNISCVSSSSGGAVNQSNCDVDLDIFILPKEKPCRVSCPGECVMTDWTEWNECFVHCKDYDSKSYKRGVQSRSRAVLAYAQHNNAPCPEQFWESRPCEAPHCFTFTWKVSPWRLDNTRTIWCERSDGLVVYGGCTNNTQPDNVLSCQPPCSLKGSVCNNTNECSCLPGYRPVFNRLQVLLDCVRMENYTVEYTAPGSVTLPTDGPTNVWMYAVIAAGTLFVIFLAVACYTMSEFFHKGPRPRRKDDNETKQDGTEGLNGATPDDCRQDTSASCNMQAVDRSVSPSHSVCAHACFQFARDHAVKLPRCFHFFSNQRRGSVNDDSPTYTSQGVPLHDSTRLHSSGEHALYCDTDIDDVLYCDGNTHRKILITESQNGGTRTIVEPETNVRGRSNGQMYTDVIPSKPERDIIFKERNPHSIPKIDITSDTETSPYIDNKVLRNGRPKQLAFDSLHRNHNISLHSIRTDCDPHMESLESDKLISQNVDHPDDLGSVSPIGVVNERARSLHSEEEPFDEFDSGRPLLGLSTFPRRSPAAVILLKSRSLEQAEAYGSDDSFENSGSLHSQLSAHSKASRLSKLSMFSGPVVQIDPEEARSVRERSPMNGRSRTLPSKKLNIGYCAYSSQDSEDGPNSSVSGDSDFSPRSLGPPEAHREASLTTASERHGKNVALDSLRLKSSQGKKSDVDSGNGSFKDLDNSPVQQGHLRNKSGTPKLTVTKLPSLGSGTELKALSDPTQAHISSGPVPSPVHQDARSKRGTLTKQVARESANPQT